jgi:triphosphoribosyl-dephospho-CoA synthase
MGRLMASSEVAAAAQLACLLEASAPKPGNVSPGRNFSDLAYVDFLASAAAIGEPFLHSRERRVGETILPSTWRSITCVPP